MINWLDLLNAQTTWSAKDHLEGFISDLLGQPVATWSKNGAISSENAKLVSNAIIYMRYQLSAKHFNAPVNLNFANERLGQCHFRLHQPEPGSNCQLPLLRAVPAGTDEDSVVAALIDTYVLQFSQYISSAIECLPSYIVSRCEGLHKAAQLAECDQYYQDNKELESQWISELKTADHKALDHLLEVARCADFFLQKGNGKFCSDACRFSTFAIRKQVSDPKYHAEKQKRYRSKVKDP